MPVFSEGSREHNLGIMINLMIVLFATIGLEIGFSELGLRFESMLPNLDPFLSMLGDHLLQTTLIALVGIVLLYLGKRKLSRIE